MHQSKLKKAALKVIAQLLTEEEIKKLRDVFRSMDADNDGTITEQEFSSGLHAAGYTVLENEVRDLVGGIHRDKLQAQIEIDYSGFLAATLQRNQFLRQERMQYAFSIFDKDGDGTISECWWNVVLLNVQ